MINLGRNSSKPEQYNYVMKSIRLIIVGVLIGLVTVPVIPSKSVYSQYHYFGRNKVQYTDFDWHILQTEHFNIYFDPEMREIAEIGAAEAERSYDRLSAIMDHTLTERVPLIFYSSHLLFQQTNVTPGFIPEGVGGFFEFIKGRVVVPSDGDIYQFRRVIRHELVHVVMTSKVNRILKDANTITHPGVPLFIVEGLAEYWSTDVLDPQSKMILRDAMLNNYFVPLTRIGAISGTYLMYKEGESLLHFIADQYGEEKILLLLENIWRSENFGEVMEFVLGESIEEINDKWFSWLKKQYYPLMESESLPSLSNRLTTEGANHSGSIFKKDGQMYLAFVSNRTGYTNIYYRPLKENGETGEVSLLVRGERNKQYESFHFMDSGLDISRNNMLAFVTKSGERDALHLWDINEERNVKSYTFPNLVGISSPSWSEDGTKIVFSGMQFSGMVDIYVFDTTSEKLLRLTGDIYNDRAPVFGPDERFIYFSSDRTEFGPESYSNIFRFELGSGNIEYVTHERSHDTTPAISPDGKRLVFISDRGGTNNIWIMNLDEFGDSPDASYSVRAVSDYATAALHPAWVDDSTLVSTAFNNYQFQLHTIHVRPEEKTQVSVPYANNNFWRYPHISLDSNANTVKPYQRKYSMDLAMSQVSNDPIFGTSGGGQIAFSDIMGNHRWELLLYNTAESAGDFWERFNVLVSKYNLENRTNWGTGIFHFNNLYYTPREGFYNEKRYGGMFMLRYPFSQFRRLELSVSAAYSEKTVYDFTNSSRQAFLFSNFFSYVKDNSIWGVSGPIDGERIMLQAGFTNDVHYNNVSYYTLIGDYRRYFRLHPRITYAVRVMGLRSEGYEPQRFYIGGSWTLRGYPRFRIWGKNAFLWNNELRFPLIDQLGILFPFGGIGFQQIRGAIFVDAGNAWENEFAGIRGSFGIGFRINLGGALVLRYDIGRRTNFKSIGSQTFYQFFFGWDY